MTKLSGIRYEFHPNVPIEEHARKVAELSLDIGIAPLVDNPFNRHKSCIKYYEYAMSGAVTVASHTVPYSDEVSITAKNNREAWKQKLEMVLTGDRAAMWREQRDWVLANRNIETTVEQWERVLGAGRGEELGLEHETPSALAWKNRFPYERATVRHRLTEHLHRPVPPPDAETPGCLDAGRNRDRLRGYGGRHQRWRRFRFHTSFNRRVS